MLLKNWDKEKAKKIFDLLDMSQWGKTLSVGVRLLIVVLIAIGLIYGIGYWRGIKSTNAVIDIGYEEEITMPAPEGYEYLDYLAIHKAKDSNNWDWINYKSKEIYTKVKTLDIPQSKKLRPYGFESKLIGFYGIGSGIEYTGVEAGVGYRFARIWNFRTELIGTNKGGYISCSYKVKKFVFENTYINAGIGKGYRGDDRAILGINVEF